MRKMIQALLYLTCCLLLCSRTIAAEKSIVVGQIIDLSGPNASIGLDYVAGITSYFDNANQNGGINGKQIRFIVRDDRGDPKLAAKAAQELLDKEDAQYLLGGIGAEVTRAILANPIFINSNLTLFAPLTDAQPEFGKRAVVWRPGKQQEIKYIFSHFEKLGFKKIGITYGASNPDQASFSMVEKEIALRKMQLVSRVQLSSNAKEMKEQISKLAQSTPDIVICLADTINTGLFLKAFRKVAPNTFVAGTSMINLATLTEIAGSNATEWTVFSQVVPNPGSSRTPLQMEHAKMMRKFRDEPASAMTLEGFAVAKTLGYAIQSGKGNVGIHTLNRVTLDLGGLQLVHTDGNHNLSQFVDLALIRRGGKLLY